MSKGRTLPTNYVLPPNPSWLSFDRSDGSLNRLPTNTTPNPDSNGHVNFMRPCQLDESISAHWRRQIGAELAKRLNYPEGPNYVIKEWPAGYQLFDHHKGPQDAPRHDPYLVGSEFVARFRSPAEFIPHAIWLLNDSTLNRSNCACKYCSRTPQRTISDSLGLSQSGRRHSTPTPGRTTGPQQPHKVYASTRRAPATVKSLTGPKQYMVPEREKDLRAAFLTKGKTNKRWAREGELVWCALDPPIAIGDQSFADEGILFWPGLVQEVRLKTVTKPLDDTKDEDIEMGDGTGHSDPNGLPKDDSSAHSAASKVAHDDDVPWTVIQSTVYKMKLLAVSTDCIVPDSFILPYQAYAPSNDLLRAIQSIKVTADEENEVDLNLNGEDMDKTAREEQLMHKFSQFQPMLDESQPDHPDKTNVNARFREAAGPFALAIQIASRVAGYWTPTDEWQAKLTTPTSTPWNRSALSQQHVPPPAAGSTPAHMTSTQPPTMITTSAGTSASIRAPNLPHESQTHNTRMLGQHPRDSSQWTQTRFQGLWWGAERIWAEDLVRLKVGRYQLAPEGTNIIKKPSPPSNIAKSFATERDADADAAEHIEPIGAAGRGVFMKIEGIFIVDVPRTNGSGSTKECRVCGMLYELADEGWVEPEEPSLVTDPNNITAINGSANSTSMTSDVKGKGKAIETVEEQNWLGPDGTIAPIMLMTPPPSTSGSWQAGPSHIVGPSQPSNNAVSNISPTQPTPPAPAKPVALSGPSEPSSYPLPVAPTGYWFRPILPPTHEAVFDLTLVSGRYYPKLLVHPLLNTVLAHQHVNASTPLWALEGLISGVHNAVDPIKWKSTRVGMVKEADTLAKRELFDYWRKMGPEVYNSDNSM